MLCKQSLPNIAKKIPIFVFFQNICMNEIFLKSSKSPFPTKYNETYFKIMNKNQKYIVHVVAFLPMMFKP